MAVRRLAVIGGGAMGTAVISGLLASKLLDPPHIVVADVIESRAEALHDEFGVSVHVNAGDAVSGADVVLLAVKPQDGESAVRSVADFVDTGACVVSIMAGIPLRRLEEWLGGEVAVVRAMPNTAALVRSAVTAISPGAHAAESHLEDARTVLGAVGTVLVLGEDKLDAVTAVSGSGPAYVFLVAEAMIDAGVSAGLPRDVSTILTTETIAGAAELLRATGRTPAELRAQVTSPAGTTAAGVGALERHAVRNAFLEAVYAAAARSRELGSAT